MHQNPRKPRDSDTGPPCHPRDQSRPSILNQPHAEPALHGHAAPAARPPEPSGYTRRGNGPRFSPTRRDAGEPRTTSGPERRSHADQAARHTDLWWPIHARNLHSTGSRAPCTSPPDRRAAPRSEPGTAARAAPGTDTDDRYPPREPVATSCLHHDPATDARTTYHTNP
jgi:hypothetical protein